MVTTWSGLITSNQQEVSVLFSNITSSTSIQGQPQKIIASLDGIHDPYLATINLSAVQNISSSTTKQLLGYQKVTGMILTDLSGPNFTNNWRMLYPYLYLKQQFWFLHTEMDSMHPLKSSKSSFTTHISKNSWWNHTVKYCGMTTQEKVWCATPQQIMEQQKKMQQIKTSSLNSTLCPIC